MRSALSGSRIESAKVRPSSRPGAAKKFGDGEAYEDEADRVGEYEVGGGAVYDDEGPPRVYEVPDEDGPPRVYEVPEAACGRVAS